MTRIQFTIDSDEYEVEINPPMGDIDQVYRSQDEIRERVEQAGYEFVDQPPQYRILAKKHKQSGSSSIIDLGDITGKVRPLGGGDEAEENTEDASDEDEVDVDSDGNVEITLIGPNGNEETRTYGENQAVGGVAADLKRVNDDISHQRRVVIYRSSERNRELSRDRVVSSLGGERLFWTAEDRL